MRIFATDAFHEALRRLGRVEQDLASCADNLSPYPTDGCCESPELHVVTLCLSQECGAEFEDGTLTASTNGWDDMADMVGPEYLTCLTCDGVWSTPQDLVWL